MEASLVTMCDSAFSHADGDLSILQAWAFLKVPGLPAKQPICSLAVRLSFDYEDDGEYTIGFRIIDETGHVLAHDENIAISLSSNHGEHPTSFIAFVASFPEGLEFQTEGQHAIVLTLDGADLHRSAFYIAVEPS
jgi:hypothetical protein